MIHDYYENSYFQIKGLLNENNIEPGVLVVTNGIIELLQVSSILQAFVLNSKTYCSLLQICNVELVQCKPLKKLLIVRIKFCGNCELCMNGSIQRDIEII